MSKEYDYFWLSHLWQIPTRKLWQCLRLCEDPEELQTIEVSALGGYLTKRECGYIESLRQRPDLPERWKRFQTAGYRFVSIDCPEYPEKLAELSDPPLGLYYQGELLLNRPLVAIVGSRTATTYGCELAYQIARKLAVNGMGIISGLAAGIDGAGHRGCLDGNGYTIGVLGSGLETVYPKEHFRLYETIRQRGCLLSEYPPDLTPRPPLFPRRNRIISGLSDFVLVVEAREKSGSLITADLALEQGRDVGAVPGRPCDPVSTGCNRLIQQGATCILSAEDVLAELMDSTRFRQIMGGEASVNLDLGLAPKEKMVYSCLRLEPKFIDDILCQLPFPVWEGIQLLTELEVKGMIKQNPHHYYYRTE